MEHIRTVMSSSLPTLPTAVVKLWSTSSSMPGQSFTAGSRDAWRRRCGQFRGSCGNSRFSVALCTSKPSVRAKCLEPRPASLACVSEFAKQTGDYHALSVADLKIIALTHELEVQEHGQVNLRAAPKRVNITTGVSHQQCTRCSSSQRQRSKGRAQRSRIIDGG